MNNKKSVDNRNNGVMGLLTNKNTYIFLFAAIIILSFLIWLFMLIKEGKDSSQFNVFFLGCGDFLADVTNVTGYSSKLDPYHDMTYTGLQEKGYPPLTYVFTYFLSRIVDIDAYRAQNYYLNMFSNPRYMIIIMILLGATLIFLFELIRRNIKVEKDCLKICLAVSIFVSAPMLYSYERGNTILLTLGFVMLYLFYYDHENKVLKEIALISLAVAVALKMTPVILGVILLFDKKFKEAVRACIYGAIMFFVPFLFFEGGFSNIPQFFENIKLNLEAYKSSDGATLYASFLSLSGGLYDAGTESLFKVLTIIISILLIGFALFAKNKWEKVMYFSIVLLILPSHSGYYCLLYLIPALIVFLNEEVHKPHNIIIVISYILIGFDVMKSEEAKGVFDYHLGIVILVVYMLVAGGISTVKNICEMKKRRHDMSL